MGIRERGARKKLTEAALHWAGHDLTPDAAAAEVDQNVLDGLRRMGVDVLDMEPLSQTPEEAVCEVWEENWASLEFFCAVGTQWVYVSGITVRRMGLNYAGCESAARALGLKWRERWPDLQVMERAVLSGDHEARVRAAEQG